MLTNTSWRERKLNKRLSIMLKNCFVCFFNVLTRQILFDNTTLETSVCRVTPTLEIKKRHGNSRQNFATEEEAFLDCREILIVSGKF